jgi:Fur family transcriptional regulator, stress-responsive regulator
MPTASKSKALSPHEETVAAALRRSGYRVTAQRLVVGEALADAGRHLTAEEVMGAVAERLPNVSLPTVYSALDALEDAGLVRRVAGARGAAMFDAGPAGHHHLVCRRCGAVTDIEAEVGLDAAYAGARRHGFHAEGAEVVVRGLCARCRAAG